MQNDESKISFERQHLLCDPKLMGEKQFIIIGCGTVGSHAAMQLALLGATKFLLIDPDIVEAHNLPSQRFNISDLGRKKVDALKDAIEAVSDICEVTTQVEPYKADDLLPDGIVILAVDKMSVRKEAMETLAWNMGHELVVESRTGGETIQLLFVNPCSVSDLKFWDTMWFDDKDAEPVACGGQSVAFVGALSGGMIAAGVCQFIMKDEVTRFWSFEPSIALAPFKQEQQV